MPYKVKKQGDQYCVVKDDGSAVDGGCHMTKADAEQHMQALYANVSDVARALPPYDHWRMLNPDGAAHPGAMIALLLDDAIANALIEACTPLEVAPDHVTLLYLAPDAAELAAQKNALIASLASCASQTGPITGAINGYGRFQASDDGRTAIYANVDCPELAAFRERLCQAACACGIELPHEHGFTPHTTLAYLSADAAMPDLAIPAIPLSFDRVALVWGSETLTFPLNVVTPSESPPVPYVYVEQPAAMVYDEYRAAPHHPRAIRAYCERAAAVASGTPGTPIPFIAGSEGIKRDGLNLVMRGARLDNYKKNPVVLWGHDYTGQRLPIGRAEAAVEGPRLRALVTFDQKDDFARQIEQKYRDGYLHTVSVGWNPLKMSGRNIAEWELLDVSAVPVPGDADALIQRQLRALRALSAEPVADLPDFDSVAADMAALYLFPLERPARQWRTTYHALAREYEKLDKTPPERLPPDYLAALDSEALAGLFLEGESELLPDLFAKRRAIVEFATLPPALRSALTEAQSLIARLLERTEQSTDEQQPTSPLDPPQIDPVLARLHAALMTRSTS